MSNNGEPCCGIPGSIAGMTNNAQRFRDLHTGPILRLPNCWDAASAAVIAAAGAPAVATTSAGVA